MATVFYCFYTINDMLRAEIRQQKNSMLLFSDKNVQVPGMGN